MKYFDYPEHASWQSHYVEHSRGCFFLIFNKQFMDENLPPSLLKYGDETFQVELILRRIPEVRYLDELPPAYELSKSIVLDEEYKEHDAWTLQHYFYSEHYCPCHRVWGAELHGGYKPLEEHYNPGPRDDCGSILFDVSKIYCRNHPNLILYSETMSYVELEEKLKEV
jgi:hypothetical protein